MWGERAVVLALLLMLWALWRWPPKGSDECDAEETPPSSPSEDDLKEREAEVRKQIAQELHDMPGVAGMIPRYAAIAVAMNRGEVSE